MSLPFSMPKMPKRSMIVRTLVIFLILLSGSIFLSKKSTSEPQASPSENTETPPIHVTLKKAGDLKTTVTTNHLPGVIVSENETKIFAAASGTVATAPFEVGDAVALGTVLLRIDTPFISATSKDGLPSDTIRQAEIAVSLAKKSYKDANRLAEKESTKSVANTLARDLAKLRLESAEIALENARNNALVRATLSGVISKKNVAIGSAVSPGTELFTLASGSAPSIRFHVSNTIRQGLSRGESIAVHSGEISSEARITSIGAVADPSTGKFPVEAKLANSNLRAGTVATVNLTSKDTLAETHTFSLPLSAITTGQDGSFFFIQESGKAKKVNATSITVSGETGIVSADISNDAEVIVGSGKALEEGVSIDTEA